jgi:hypothetical protein
MEGVRPQRYPTASGLAATGEPHTFGADACGMPLKCRLFTYAAWLPCAAVDCS